MNARKITIAAFGSLLLIGGIAHAASDDKGWGGRHGHRNGEQGMMDQRGPKGAMRADTAFVRMLKLADANKDGKVTKDEADAAFLKVFDEIDANKDGAATPGEFRTYMQARMEAFRKDHPRPVAEDQQGKGAGMGNGMGQQAMDGNQKGKSPDGKGPEGKGMMGGHRFADNEDGPRGEGHRFGKHHGDRDGMRPMRASFMMRQADTDENGQVSRDEAKAFGDKIFAHLDTNKDGVISIDDLPDRPFP